MDVDPIENSDANENANTNPNECVSDEKRLKRSVMALNVLLGTFLSLVFTIVMFIFIPGFVSAIMANGECQASSVFGSCQVGLEEMQTLGWIKGYVESIGFFIASPFIYFTMPVKDYCQRVSWSFCRINYLNCRVASTILSPVFFLSDMLQYASCRVLSYTVRGVVEFFHLMLNMMLKLFSDEHVHLMRSYFSNSCPLPKDLRTTALACQLPKCFRKTCEDANDTECTAEHYEDLHFIA